MHLYQRAALSNSEQVEARSLTGIEAGLLTTTMCSSACTMVTGVSLCTYAVSANKKRADETLTHLQDRWFVAVSVVSDHISVLDDVIQRNGAVLHANAAGLNRHFLFASTNMIDYCQPNTKQPNITYIIRLVIRHKLFGVQLPQFAAPPSPFGVRCVRVSVRLHVSQT
jgi:hypothetical protein